MRTTILLTVVSFCALLHAQEENAIISGIDTVFTKSLVIEDNQEFNNVGVEFMNSQATFWNSMASGGNGNLTLGANWLGRGEPSDLTKSSFAIRMKPRSDQLGRIEFRRSPIGSVFLDQLLFKIDSTTSTYYVNMDMNSNNVQNVDSIQSKIIETDTLILNDTIFYSIPPQQFISKNPYIDSIEISDGELTVNEDSIVLNCGINLIHNSTILSCIIYGNSTDKTWELLRSNVSSSNTETMGSNNINSSDTTISDAEIDNENYTYSIKIPNCDANDKIYGGKMKILVKKL